MGDAIICASLGEGKILIVKSIISTVEKSRGGRPADFINEGGGASSGVGGWRRQGVRKRDKQKDWP